MYVKQALISSPENSQCFAGFFVILPSITGACFRYDLSTFSALFQSWGWWLRDVLPVCRGRYMHTITPWEEDPPMLEGPAPPLVAPAPPESSTSPLISMAPILGDIHLLVKCIILNSNSTGIWGFISVFVFFVQPPFRTGRQLIGNSPRSLPASLAARHSASSQKRRNQHRP